MMNRFSGIGLIVTGFHNETSEEHEHLLFKMKRKIVKLNITQYAMVHARTNTQTYILT
jgi:hypothetical protein